MSAPLVSTFQESVQGASQDCVSTPSFGLLPNIDLESTIDDPIANSWLTRPIDNEGSSFDTRNTLPNGPHQPDNRVALTVVDHGGDPATRTHLFFSPVSDKDSLVAIPDRSCAPSPQSKPHGMYKAGQPNELTLLSLNDSNIGDVGVLLSAGADKSDPNKLSISTIMSGTSASDMNEFSTMPATAMADLGEFLTMPATAMADLGEFLTMPDTAMADLGEFLTMPDTAMADLGEITAISDTINPSQLSNTVNDLESVRARQWCNGS
jgi:hypothetical protein